MAHNRQGPGTTHHFMRIPLMAVTLAAAFAVLSANADDAARAGWDTSLALGLNTTDGNSDTLSVYGSLTAANEGPNVDTRLGLEVNYGKSDVTVTVDGMSSTDTETTTENAKAYAIFKRKLEEAYLYSDNSLFHDDLASLDYRLMLGAGVGRFLLETDASKFGLELGAVAAWEDYTGEEDDGYVSLRFAQRLDHAFSEKSKGWETVEYIPQADDFDAYLLNFEVGAEAAMNSKLSLRVVLQDRYNSTPPAGIDKNDLTVIGSLVMML